MKTFPLALTFFSALLLFTGCPGTDDEDLLVLDVPETYNFTRAGASTVSFVGQTTRIAMAEELANALLDPATGLDQLNALFRNPADADPFMDAELNESTKSLRSKVAASSVLFGTAADRTAAIRTDFDGWLSGQATEVFPAWNEVAAPGQAGQIADGGSVRYVNGWGLEYNQAFTKALIGALMFDQVANNYLAPAVLDAGTARTDNEAEVLEGDNNYTYMEHRWDEAFGYVFGASATPATPLDDLETADGFLNKYLGRVENDPDFAGIAAAVEQDFRTGRQAIVQNAWEERDRAASTLRENLGRVLMIRAVYYLKQGEANLRAVPVRRGAAFHDLSEGYGFVYSLRFLRDDGDAVRDWSSISDDLLTALRNADGEGWWDIDPAVLAELAEQIATEGGFSVTAAAN